MDPLIKERELVQAIAGSPWIHVGHDAPILIESKILILQAVERSCEQS